MPFTHAITRSVSSSGGEGLGATNSYSAASETKLSETVADGITDKLVNIAIDVSEVKSFFILSDYAVTVETNDGGAPSNTLVLKANVPYMWDTDSYDTFKLTVDVTKIYLTNASGSTATVEIRLIQDPTP